MNPLFNSVGVFAVIENQKEELRKAFQGVEDTELDADPVAVATRLIEQFSINVPILDEQKKYALTREIQVDVSRDQRRRIYDRSRPFYITGTEVRIVVPFQGDAGLFDVQPTMFTLNPPFGEVHDQELNLVYELTDAAFDVEGAADRTIGQVKQYLQSLQDSAEQLKHDLHQLVNSLIEGRKQERGTHSQIVASLKIPVKQAKPAPPATAPTSSVRAPTRSKVTEKQRGEWDVFVSHASEDKEAIARPLAESLRAKGLRVWYDDFSLRLGDSLRQSIDRGLARSRFGVVILSVRFFEKHWPQQELNGLVSREVNGGKIILPVWHEVGFTEVRSYSPILADRLAVQTKDGIEHVVEKIMEVVGDTGASHDPHASVSEPNANPFLEEKVRHVRQVVRETMTLNGQLLLRWLLLNRRIECGKQFMPEISIDTQNRQIKIAVEAGIVQRVGKRLDLLRTYYVVNPELKPRLRRSCQRYLRAKNERARRTGGPGSRPDFGR
jgi:hypothetical protein